MCNVARNKRKSCTWCRYQQCLRVGMDPSMVQMGRTNKQTVALDTERFPSASGESTEVMVQSPDKSSRDTVEQVDTIDNYGYDTTKNEYTWFQFSTGFRGRVVEMRGTTYNQYTYEFVVEVSLSNGTIVGTSWKYNELLKNQPPPFPDNNLSSTTYFHNHRNGSHAIMKHNDLSLQLSLILSEVSITVLTHVCESEWSLLQQISNAYHILDYSLLPKYFAMNDCGSGKKRILLSVGHLPNLIFQFMDCLNIYKNLCIVDQVILQKESIAEVAFMVGTYAYDRDTHSFCHSCFNGSLLHFLHFDVLKRKGAVQGKHVIYQDHFDRIPDFFRKDPVALTTLAFLGVFQSRTGLTDEEAVTSARKQLMSLLKKYSEGKIKSASWNTSLVQVEHYIQEAQNNMRRFKGLFDAYVSEATRTNNSN